MSPKDKVAEVYANLAHQLRRIQRQEYTSKLPCTHCGALPDRHLPDRRCSASATSREYLTQGTYREEVEKLTKALRLMDELYDVMGWN